MGVNDTAGFILYRVICRSITTCTHHMYSVRNSDLRVTHFKPYPGQPALQQRVEPCKWGMVWLSCKEDPSRGCLSPHPSEAVEDTLPSMRDKGLPHTGHSGYQGPHPEFAGHSPVFIPRHLGFIQHNWYCMCPINTLFSFSLTFFLYTTFFFISFYYGSSASLLSSIAEGGLCNVVIPRTLQTYIRMQPPTSLLGSRSSKCTYVHLVHSISIFLSSASSSNNTISSHDDSSFNSISDKSSRSMISCAIVNAGSCWKMEVLKGAGPWQLCCNISCGRYDQEFWLRWWKHVNISFIPQGCLKIDLVLSQLWSALSWTCGDCSTWSIW